MRRRYALKFLLFSIGAAFILSGVPLVKSESDATPSSLESEAAAIVEEVIVDAIGEVHVEDKAVDEGRSGNSEETEDVELQAEVDAAVEAAEAEAARAVEEAATEAKAEADEAIRKVEAVAAAAEASNAVDEEVKTETLAFVSKFTNSAKSKAVNIVDRAKDVTPEEMKKVAAGVLGLWGAAAGIGWAMNNLGGNDN